jgi:hypothetical protein
MNNNGSLRSIKAAREKKKLKEAELHELVRNLEERVNRLSAAMEQFGRATKDLVGAHNNSTLLLSCLERWMDSNHPGWDENIRKDMEHRTALLQESRQIKTLFASVRPDAPDGPSPEERLEAGLRIWEVAKELGSTLQDGPLAISLLLQGKGVKEAKDVLAEYKTAHNAEIPAQLAPLLRKLEERAEEVERGERRIWTPNDGR